MNDIIEVNTDNMYEFCRALSDFEDSLDEFSQGVSKLTADLGSAMENCSRYGQVVAEIKKSAKNIEGKLRQIHSAAHDLHSRADFMEDFERGVDMPSGVRSINEI